MSRLSKAAFGILLFGMGLLLAVIMGLQAKEAQKPQRHANPTPEWEIERHTREETIAYLKRVYGKADFGAALDRIAALEETMQKCRWCNACQSYGWRAY